MKKILFVALFGLSACSLWDKKADEPVSPPKVCDRGVFHAGPYTDPETEKTCNAPGGFCDSDKRCHSSALKCPCK